MKYSIFAFSLYCQNQDYIVVLKSDSKLDVHLNSLHSFYNFNDKIEDFFDEDLLVGYAANLSVDEVRSLSSLKDVDYIQKNNIFKKLEIQKDAPWNLARVSSRNKVSGKMHYIHSNSGQHVDVYILDTGVDVSHSEFEGRAKWGYNSAQNSTNQDVDGHGTHVAGIVSGKTYGVAKKANIIAVKVLGDNGEGSDSDVIKGISWAYKRAKKSKNKGNVVNMSLGGDYSKVLNSVIKKASNLLTFVVAAGNENDDACKYSPSSEASALTVAASTIEDKKADFSNFGRCVDIIAPGQNITSSWIGEDETLTISGTSMASPHIAGIVAHYLSISKKKLTAKQVAKLVLKHCTKNKISGFDKNTNNYLGFSGNF